MTGELLICKNCHSFNTKQLPSMENNYLKFDSAFDIFLNNFMKTHPFVVRKFKCQFTSKSIRHNDA